MAKQRQTDVNINYKVNTVEIEKGNAVLSRASQATDQLRAATQNFGTSAGKSFQSASKYIEGMEIELARLRQQIKLTNTQDTARLAQLSNQYKALKQQVDAYNKALFEQSAATKQATQSTQGLATQFGQVVQAVRLFIAAGVVREIANISLEAAKLAGNVEGVEKAFNRAFHGAESILSDLRESTHGTVSDFELMQRSLQATNLGVSVEHLGVLFEFAATRAQQTGESVDYLVDSIVRGIGRKSILILDNLGLSATRLREQFNGASLASQSVADVTVGVAEIAKVELAKMGGFVETSATQVDQLTVSWKELKEEMSLAITEGSGGGLIGFMKDYVDSFKAWIEAHNRGIDVSEVFAEQQRKEIARISENEFVNRVFTKSKEENIKILQEEIQLLTKSIGSWAALRDTNFDVIESLKEERSELQKRQLTDLFFGSENKKRLKELEEQIALRERLTEANKEDVLIDQEILKLLQARLIALKKVNKEENEVEKELRDRIFTKDTLFDTKVVPKAPFDKRMLSNNPLVDVQGQLQEAANQLFIVLPVTVRPVPFEDSEWTKSWEKMKGEVIDRSINITQSLIDAELQMEVDAYSERIDQLKRFYDEQILLAGDNERAKSELRVREDRELKKLEREKADREKKAAQAGILVNTALAIVKVFAGEGTYVDKIIRAAIFAAEGAAQYRIATRTRYYAKGEIDIKGPGTKTSDSIPARLSKGESVMTADETASSKGIFKAIRARKLNDKVLKEITSERSGGQSIQSFDDSRLLKKLDEVKNATPDVKRVGNLMYETKVKTDTYKMWVRSKSMNV